MQYYHHEQKEKMLSNPCNKKLDAVLQKYFPENDKWGACVLFNRGNVETIEINKLSDVTQKGSTWTHYASIGVYQSNDSNDGQYWEVYSQFNGEKEDEHGVPLLSQQGEQYKGSHCVDGYDGEVEHTAVVEVMIHDPHRRHLVQPACKACGCKFKYIAEVYPHRLGFFVLCHSLPDLCAEGHESQLCQLEHLHTKGDTYYGHAEQQSEYGKFKCHFDSAEYEPEYIHQQTYCTSAVSYLLAEWAEAKLCHFEALCPDRYANDGDTPQKSDQQPAQSAEKSAENKP